MSGKQNVIQIRTQVEDDLRESQARLRLALDASGIGMWDANFVSGKVLLDSHWAEMVGGEPGETLLQFRALLKQVAPDERATAEKLIRAVRRGDGDDYRMEQASATGWATGSGSKAVDASSLAMPLVPLCA